MESSKSIATTKCQSKTHNISNVRKNGQFLSSISSESIKWHHRKRNTLEKIERIYMRGTSENSNKHDDRRNCPFFESLSLSMTVLLLLVFPLSISLPFRVTLSLPLYHSCSLTPSLHQVLYSPPASFLLLVRAASLTRARVISSSLWVNYLASISMANRF